MEALRLERLEAWRQSLESLLSGFEGARRPDPAVLEDLWRGCAQAFDGFRSAMEEVDEPPSNVLTRRMESVLKLNAVVTSVAVRTKEELAVELGNLAGARAVLERRTVAREGESVDIRG